MRARIRAMFKVTFEERVRLQKVKGPECLLAQLYSVHTILESRLLPCRMEPMKRGPVSCSEEIYHLISTAAVFGAFIHALRGVGAGSFSGGGLV